MTQPAPEPLPPEPKPNQLVALILATARGEMEPAAFVGVYRKTYEALEAQGRIQYTSPEQARLIWDVLWDLEYFSSDPGHEATPEEWHALGDIMKTIKRVAPKLAEL